MIPTECPEILTECPEIPTECPVNETLCPNSPTWCPLIPTECPVIPTECPVVVPTECPEIPTECPEIPTECPEILTECPVIPTECPEIPTECPEIPTECPEIPTECPEIPTECPEIPTECPHLETECPISPTGCPVVPTECPNLDRDGDGLFNVCDNCDDDYNPLQEDSYPPGGNDCGDACECEGNFDGDLNQDADDAAIFQIDFGRTDCTNSTPCNGDFDCDGNVDEDDQTIFLSDFGRSEYNMNPCPTCATEPWCVYTVQSDSDDDGIYDDNDNCPNHPNGPLGGTCTSRSIGDLCVNDEECGVVVEGVCVGSTCTSGNIGTPCDVDDDCDVHGFCSMNQEDTYPPDGNGCGDACECEGNFNPDVDDDVDGSDAAIFKADFGRGGYNDPCESGNPCDGDFDCDTDVDGTDASLFKSDYGRGGYNNPCPSCPTTDPWCEYTTTTTTVPEGSTCTKPEDCGAGYCCGVVPGTSNPCDWVLECQLLATYPQCAFCQSSSDCPVGCCCPDCLPEPCIDFSFCTADIACTLGCESTCN